MPAFQSSSVPFDQTTIPAPKLPDLDFYVSELPTVKELAAFLFKQFGVNAELLGTHHSERYDSHFFEVGGYKLIAKIDKPQEISKLPTGLLVDHLAALDPDLPQLAKIRGLIILDNRELVGIFKQHIEGKSLLAAIDQGEYTKESLTGELLELYDKWAKRGYILTDQVLSNFVKSSDNKLYQVDPGALFHLRDLDPTYQGFMRDALVGQIDLAFELHAKGYKLAELKEPI